MENRQYLVLLHAVVQDKAEVLRDISPAYVTSVSIIKYADNEQDTPSCHIRQNMTDAESQKRSLFLGRQRDENQWRKVKGQ